MSGSEILTMIGISILIFCARILDVSLDTMRIIFISRGSRLIPPLLGFFEVLIWLLAITQIFRNLNGFVYYVAYAGGFAMGNFVGICIERKLAVGNLIIRVITGKDSTELLNHLNNEGFGFTTVNAEGSQGSVKIIFMVIKRRNLEKVSDIIKRFHPTAFLSIEEVREAREGIFPPRKTSILKDFFNLHRIIYRK